MAVRNQKAKRREVQELNQERISRQRKAVSSPGRVAWEGTAGQAGGKGRCPNRYALVSMRSPALDTSVEDEVSSEQSPDVP